ncbi:MAG TPA: PRK06851 family protein [Syntrophomonadaceae bacterium]|nr:PRK06851 family protein [Syntrophomonadaceae bacterium]
MGKTRDMFPGGNTCYGFYSYYDYICPSPPEAKIVLKGGPGVGKSTFMKNLGKDFSRQGQDIEYHWCSSDNNSLDGLVIGKNEICILDGTAPHIVDPRYPGAVDKILNLGQFWDESKIKQQRNNVITLTDAISLLFKRSYHRLKEVKLAYEEWQSYYEEATDFKAVSRNVLELVDDIFKNSAATGYGPRHLFAAAITPEGIVNKANSLVDKDYFVFAVKGQPGSGINRLYRHTLEVASLKGVYAEVYHNPFDPEEIDMIIFPHHKTVLVDISDHIADYVQQLPSTRYKRFLDFTQFIDQSKTDKSAKQIYNTQNRVHEGLKDAVKFIETAKKYHDELETIYIPAMDFDAIASCREKLIEELNQIILKREPE